MREYAVSELSGERFLVRIHCDEPHCPESIAPHAAIAESGWIKRGMTTPGGDLIVWDYCPAHASFRWHP